MIRGLEMGEIIPFPVSETYLRTLGSYEHHVPKVFFDLRSGNGEIIHFLFRKYFQLILESLDQINIMFLKNFFDQRTGNC